MSIVIAVCGKAKHGKDTCSLFIKEYLKDKYNVDSSIISFAKPLKEEALKYIGVDTIEELDYYKNNKIKKNGIDVRKLLQQLGDSNKINNEDYYVKLLDQHIMSNPGNYIVSDLRYVSENKLITIYKNGYTIKIHRDVKNTMTHSSEVELDNIHCDYYVHNVTLDKFKEDICNIVDFIVKDESDRLHLYDNIS